MSHSRLFQLSIKPLLEDERLREFDLSESDFPLCMDYFVESEDIEDDIVWLNSTTDLDGRVKLGDNGFYIDITPKFIKKIDNMQREYMKERFNNAIKELNDTSKVLNHIQYGVQLDDSFMYYLDYSMNILQLIDYLKHNDIKRLYIGTVFDYHM